MRLDLHARFMSKNGLVAQQIARQLLLCDEGKRLPTMQQYSDMLQVGTGTVQRAINDLMSVGAVKIRSRGHQGSVLLEKDATALWEIGGLGPCTGSMPLPSSKEFQGLAAGIRREFERIQIPVSMLYCHGSDLRLQSLLENRVDFIVVSRYSARQALAQNDEYVKVLEFGDFSYYAQDSVVVVTRADVHHPDHIARVGIDRSSGDHRQMTIAEFPGYEYVDVPYVDIPEAIHEGDIDGAVWHRTVLSLSLEQAGLRIHPLRHIETQQFLADMACATVLTRRDSPAQTVFPLLSVENVLDIQQQIIDRTLRPIY